jgi:hypothetical protein
MSSSPEAFAAYFKATADEPVYLLLGVQGSGTNLLSQLLTRAFNLSVLHDQSLVVRVAGQLGSSPSAHDLERGFRRIRAAMFPGPVRRRLTKAAVHADGRLDGIDEAFYRAAGPRTPAELARFIYAYRAFRIGHTGMAIKSDDIWQHVSSLDRVLPARRVVLLTRDFRDNALSIVGKHFGPCHPTIAAHYVRSRFTQYEREHARSSQAGAHVRFEDLVCTPVATIGRLGRAIGLPEPGALEERLRGLHIRPGRVGRWQALPDRQLAVCETVLRRELVAYGYGLATTASEDVSRWDYASAIAGDVAQRVPQKLRHLWRRALLRSAPGRKP